MMEKGDSTTTLEKIIYTITKKSNTSASFSGVYKKTVSGTLETHYSLNGELTVTP